MLSFLLTKLHKKNISYGTNYAFRIISIVKTPLNVLGIKVPNLIACKLKPTSFYEMYTEIVYISILNGIFFVNKQ